jgi:hypothetical protein
MDHLGIPQFAFFGKLHHCIGGSFALKLKERPRSALSQGCGSQIGQQPENPDVMYDSGRDVWAKEFRERRPEVSMQTIEKYLHSLYGARPDFV